MAGTINYVKFQRGTQEAYARIKERNALDANTLYFIYNDPENEEAGGLLYLGERLIGGTSATAISSLSDLNDVEVTDITMIDGMLLQYHISDGKWYPTSVSSIIQQASNAPAVYSGSKQNDEDDADVINRLDASPLTQDIVFVDGVPYIYDGSNWTELIGDDIEERVQILETKVGTLETQMANVDNQINTAIANVNHLTYTVVDGELPAIVTGQIDSLKNTIFLKRNSNTDTSASGEDLYDEYIFVPQIEDYERLGSWSVNLNNYATVASVEALGDRVDILEASIDNLSSTYVTQSVYSAEVGNLQDLLTNTGKTSTTLVNEIIELQDAVKWTDIE